MIPATSPAKRAGEDGAAHAGEGAHPAHRKPYLHLRVVVIAVTLFGVLLAVGVCYGALTWDHHDSIDRIKTNHKDEHHKLHHLGEEEVEAMLLRLAKYSSNAFAYTLLEALRLMLSSSHVAYDQAALAPPGVDPLLSALSQVFDPASESGTLDILLFQEYSGDGAGFLLERNTSGASARNYIDGDGDSGATVGDRTAPKSVRTFSRSNGSEWGDHPPAASGYPAMDLLRVPWVQRAVYSHATAFAYVPVEDGPMIVAVTPMPQSMYKMYYTDGDFVVDIGAENGQAEADVYVSTERRGFLIAGVRLADTVQGLSIHEHERHAVVTQAGFGGDPAMGLRIVSGPIEAEDLEEVHGKHPITGAETTLRQTRRIVESPDAVIAPVMQHMVEQMKPGEADPFARFVLDHPDGQASLHLHNGTHSVTFEVFVQGLADAFWILGIIEMDEIVAPYETEWTALESDADARLLKADDDFTRLNTFLTIPVIAMTVTVLALVAYVIQDLYVELHDLASHMADVEKMKLNDEAVSYPLSHYREVMVMEIAFRRMFASMKEFKEYIPDAVLLKVMHADDPGMSEESMSESSTESDEDLSDNGSDASSKKQGASPVNFSLNFAARTETVLLDTPSGSMMHATQKLPVHITMQNAYTDVLNQYCLSRKRVTSLTLSCVEMEQYLRGHPEPDATASFISTWLEMCTSETTTYGGVVEWFHTDHIEVSFNALIPCRNAAVRGSQYALHIRAKAAGLRGDTARSPASPDRSVVRDDSVNTGGSVRVGSPGLSAELSAKEGDPGPLLKAQSGVSAHSSWVQQQQSLFEYVSPCIGIVTYAAYAGPIGCEGYKAPVVLGKAKRMSQALMAVAKESGFDILTVEKHADMCVGSMNFAPVDLVRFGPTARPLKLMFLENALDAAQDSEWMYSLASRSAQQQQYDEAWKLLSTFSAGQTPELKFESVVSAFQSLARDSQTASTVCMNLRRYTDAVSALTGAPPEEYDKLFRTRHSGLQVTHGMAHPMERKRSMSVTSTEHSKDTVPRSPGLDSYGEDDKAGARGSGRRGRRAQKAPFQKVRAEPHDGHAGDDPIARPDGSFLIGIIGKDKSDAAASLPEFGTPAESGGTPLSASTHTSSHSLSSNTSSNFGKRSRRLHTSSRPTTPATAVPFE